MSEGTILFEYCPPLWPLPKFCILGTWDNEGTPTKIAGFPDGHFALVLEHQDKTIEHHFQRVNIPHGHIVKLAFSWNTATARAAAGGKLLSPYKEGTAPSLDIATKGNSTYEIEQFSIAHEVLHEMPRDEWLFLETLGDITRKLNTPTRYDLVRLSALLRQLLCDGEPLAIVANRRLRQNLRFEVAMVNDKPAESNKLEKPFIHIRSLFPDYKDQVVSVNLTNFLGLCVISHHNVEYTVHNVIDLVAHVFGGVHLGNSQDEEIQTLALLEREVLVFDESVIFLSLHDIAKVTLKGLMPLAKSLGMNRPTKGLKP